MAVSIAFALASALGYDMSMEDQSEMCISLSAEDTKRVRGLATKLGMADARLVIALALDRLEGSEFSGGNAAALTGNEHGEKVPTRSEPMQWCSDDYSYIEKK